MDKCYRLMLGLGLHVRVKLDQLANLHSDTLRDLAPLP